MEYKIIEIPGDSDQDLNLKPTKRKRLRQSLLGKTKGIPIEKVAEGIKRICG